MTTTRDGSSAVTVRAILFVNAFLGNIVVVLMPVFARDIARDLQADVAVVGSLIGLQGLAIGAVSVLVGPLSDQLGRKRVLWGALALNGFAAIAFALSHDLTSLIALGVLNAVCFSPLTFSALAYAGDYFPPHRRGLTVGLITAAHYAGVVIGAPAGALAIDHAGYGWRTAFLVVGALSILASLVNMAALRHIPTGREGKTIAPRSMLKVLGAFLREPRLRVFLLAFFLLRVGVGMYLVYAATYLFTVRDFPPSGILVVYPLGGALAFGTSLLGGRLASALGPRPMAVTANLLIALSIVLIVHVPTTAQTVVATMVVLCAVYMIAESLRMSALNLEAVSLVSTEVRGSFLGCTTCLVYLGYSFGAFLGGAILRWFGGSPAESLSRGFPFLVHCTAALWVLVAVLSAQRTRSYEAQTDLQRAS